MQNIQWLSSNGLCNWARSLPLGLDQCSTSKENPKKDKQRCYGETEKVKQSIMPDPMVHFKLIALWQLDENYVAVKKHVISLAWTRNIQIYELFEAVSKLYPHWRRDEFRIYGRCGDLHLPIKNYITLTATLRHMATYSSDLLYLVRTDVITESMMTVEELKIRWHVREMQRELADIHMIKTWVGDDGYEGRVPEIRGEHAPVNERPSLTSAAHKTA